MPLLDAEDRAFASFALESNIIVEAGAGTGKTRILVDRFCFRLLAEEDGVDAFVALTFTEKAAAELKIRLCAVLGDIASGRVEPDSHAAWLLAKLRELRPSDAKLFYPRAVAALAALDRAQIGTIHSFASHLLRLYPLEAGIDPSFEVDEGPLFEELFESEFEKWLETELQENSPRSADWEQLLKEADLSMLRALADSLCREKTELPGEAGDASAAAFCLDAGRRAAELLARFPPPAKGPRKLELQLAAAARVLQAFGAGELGAEGEDIDIKVTEPRGWNAEAFAQAKKFIQLAAALSSGNSGLLNLGQELLAPFVAGFRRAYSGRSAVSFDGLLVKARNLLRDNTEVRESLKRKYRAVFIDEFQDTDPLQGELLLYLCESPGGVARDWRQIKLQSGKLFVVGDPKQSIYRFRGADMGAYGQFTELMVKQGARRCFLTSNFRSSAGIIEAVNAVSGRLILEKQGLQPAYVPIAPARETENSRIPAVSVLLYAPDGKDPKKVTAGQSRRAQAGELSRRITALASGPEAARYRDIAVLIRSAAPLAEIIEAFRSAGIPYVVEEDRYFYGTQEVSDLLTLLRALADPGDEIAVAGLLRSPLCPLDDSQLYALRRAGGLDYRKTPPKGFERLAPLFELLQRLNKDAGRLPLDAFARMALGAMKCAELLPAAYNGQQTLANVEKFLAIAASFGERGRGGLEVFLAQSGRYMEERRGEGESPLADESLDAVRIMTVHKAKGLEFPIVFLPDICAAVGGGSRKPALLQDWGMGLCGLRMGKHCNRAMPVLEFRAEEHEAEEERRILYVALTRAKSRLFLLGGPKFAKDSFAAYLELAGAWPLSKSDGEESELYGRLLAVEYISAEPIRKKPPGSQKDDKAEAPTEKDCRQWAAVWARRQKEYAAAHERGTTSATAVLERERERLEPDRAEAPQSRVLGLLCHKALERHAFGGAFSEQELESASVIVAFEEGVPVSDELKASALDILSAFSAGPAYAEIAGSVIIARELPFSFLEKGESGAAVVVRGVMDLVVESAGGIKIIDYKTAGARALARGEYEAQRALYLKAAARIYPGKKCGFELVSLTDGVPLR
ncbi:MAG TPA: UvrD-helicase domain-containing protein [Elusimicrobiales bacterium]|nr:UvrD-helicase domain-containing protein [Elusimicrobiales bacterium]